MTDPLSALLRDLVRERCFPSRQDSEVCGPLHEAVIVMGRQQPLDALAQPGLASASGQQVGRTFRQGQCRRSLTTSALRAS